MPIHSIRQLWFTLIGGIALFALGLTNLIVSGSPTSWIAVALGLFFAAKAGRELRERPRD